MIDRKVVLVNDMLIIYLALHHQQSTSSNFRTIFPNIILRTQFSPKQRWKKIQCCSKLASRKAKFLRQPDFWNFNTFFIHYGQYYMSFDDLVILFFLLHHPDRKTSIVNVNVVKWFGFPRFLAMKFFLIIGSDRKACGSILRGTIEEKQRDTKSYREFFWHNGST